MLQNIPKEKILEVIRQGPTIPQKIVKIVGSDTMLIGAILSTMISTGEVKYSILKFGGSPLYYVPEDEPKLEEYISYLNEKDQKTVKILKEQKVILDNTQDPLIRVSLKTIKDFAKPFEIDKELFYRYFLVSKEEAEELARNILADSKKTSQEILTDPESSSLEKTAELKQISSSLPEVLPVPEKATHHQVTHHHRTIQTETKESVAAGKNAFFETITGHIHNLKLDIISKEKIKKTEYSLVLKNHDSNEYIYCVAKDKKTINEGDLSTAFVFSHQKKMPCMFLMTGKLTKQAEAMLEKEFKDMKIEKIEKKESV